MAWNQLGDRSHVIESLILDIAYFGKYRALLHSPIRNGSVLRPNLQGPTASGILAEALLAGLNASLQWSWWMLSNTSMEWYGRTVPDAPHTNEVGCSALG